MIICDTSIETYMLVRTMGTQKIKDIMNIRSIRVPNAQTDFESSTLYRFLGLLQINKVAKK
jgi:hypothetical protein